MGYAVKWPAYRVRSTRRCSYIPFRCAVYGNLSADFLQAVRSRYPHPSYPSVLHNRFISNLSKQHPDLVNMEKFTVYGPLRLRMR
ncbi:hypothetical protein D3C73_1311290 [compost metagenome]